MKASDFMFRLVHRLNDKYSVYCRFGISRYNGKPSGSLRASFEGTYFQVIAAKIRLCLREVGVTSKIQFMGKGTDCSCRFVAPDFVYA